MPRRPHHWLPGLIAGQGVVHPSGAACTLNYGEVYPFGLLAQISVRFRGPLSLDKQREIGSQSDSYLWNKPDRGPQLSLEQERSARSSAEIVTHEGHNTFWTITYWFGREIAPSEVSMTFSWPEQGLEVLFTVSGEDLRSAINRATELWIPDPHGYFSA
jgi:hypothetical protein